MEYNDPDHPITAILNAHAGSSSLADERLFAPIHQLMRHVGGQLMARERSDHTLSATSLANEAYVRMSRSGLENWRNRDEFRRYAATVMRNLLVDHARSRRAAKRGHGLRASQFDEEYVGSYRDFDQLIAIDDALERLSGERARCREVVDCLVFAGMSLDDTARGLDVSLATVKRDWLFARTYLRGELSAAASDRESSPGSP